MKQAMINYTKQEKFDDIYTPFTAINPVLKHIKDSNIKTIWECCDAGGSAITYDLMMAGYKVVSTDVKTGFDFLRDTPDFDFDMIVTNPPFSLKTKFLERCFLYGKPFALFLPLTALEGITRGKLYREYGVSVIVLDRRTDFTGDDRVWFNTSWFLGNFFKENRLIFEEV